MGMACHSNIKWEGVSAIDKALPFLNRVHELGQRWRSLQAHPLLPGPVTGINRIEAGAGPVIVPDHCVVEGNFTYLPGREQSLGELEAALQATMHEDPWLAQHPPQLEWIHHVRPFVTEPTGPWPQMVASSASEVLGVPAGRGVSRLTERHHRCVAPEPDIRRPVPDASQAGGQWRWRPSGPV